MLQKLIADMGTLTGEVTSLKRLDQVVMELKEQFVQSGENRREKSPLNRAGPSGPRHSEKKGKIKALQAITLTIPISQDGRKWIV